MRIGEKNVVKNILQGFFPVKCRGCGEIGGYLCVRCKKYISDSILGRKEEDCLIDDGGGSHNIFGKIRYLGYRDEILGELIEECKYECIRGIIPELAWIVGEYLDEMYCGDNNDNNSENMQSEILLVPMPTNRRHVRERGFDHMDLIARYVEKYTRGRIKRARLLERDKDTVQVGANEALRRRQAKEAVKPSKRFLDKNGKIIERIRSKKIVLIDDVWTTGASMIEAGKKLREVGVQQLDALMITKNRAKRSPVIRHGEI